MSRRFGLGYHGLGLPRDILYEIFGHVDDKALEVVPAIVHSAVRHIRSPRVVQVRPEYLTAFTRLERTTNILVHLYGENFAPLSHLRGLCVEVHLGTIETMLQLRDMFRVEDKRDDQLFIFNYIGGIVIYHNSHCVTNDPELVPDGSIWSLAPRCYFDLLKGTKPYMSRRVIDIALKYRHYGSVWVVSELLLEIRRVLGPRFAELVDRYMRDFIRDARCSWKKDPFEAVWCSIYNSDPWDVLHHYDIPDAPLELTDEEKREIEYLQDYYAERLGDD